MVENKKDENKIFSIKLETIDWGSSTITVATSGSNIPDTDHIFPANLPSVEIATLATADMIDIIEPEKTKEIIETIDYVKTHGSYLSEIEIGANWKEGIKFKFKWSPKKVVKTYFEK